MVQRNCLHAAEPEIPIEDRELKFQKKDEVFFLGLGSCSTNRISSSTTRR